MKIFILLSILSFSLTLHAQRMLLLVDTNQPCCMDGWPVDWLPTSTTDTPLGWTTNVTTLQAVNYRASVLESSEKNRQAQLQALVVLFDNFEVYDAAWKRGSNFNAVQMQAILREHNEALVRMRPILREMYKAR